GLAAVFLEGGRLQRDVARKTLELEGPDDAIWARRAMVDAVEGGRVAVGVPVDEAPRAAVADLETVDGHGQRPRPEPLHEQLRLGEGAEDELRRRVELPRDQDLWQPGFRDELCLAHDAFPAFLMLLCLAALVRAIVLLRREQLVEPLVALVPVFAV